MITEPCTPLSEAQVEFIAYLDAMFDDANKHATFIYAILREPLVDAVFMGMSLGNTHIGAAEMRFIAEHWRCGHVPEAPYSKA